MGTSCNQIDQRLNEEEKIFWDCETLETFTAVGFKMLVEATKKSNNLPFGKVRDLYESCPSFHSTTDKQADYVLSVLSSMLKHTNPDRCIEKRDDEDKFEIIVDSNDTLLENVGILLDELSGIQKNPKTTFVTKKLEPVSGSWNENKKKKSYSLGATQVLNWILNQTKNIEKPQLKFKDRINNDSSVPFEPRITYKHNMLKPLACISEINELGIRQYTHPYEFELKRFKPSPEQLKHQSPVTYKALEETPLVLVTKPEDIPEMMKDLEKYTEIAVDLEHHSYRSFQGFTCLMQISTRDTDYIIDALSLRSDLEVLNKVFTNPRVVKVFHGADLDVLWLQRDLSLYIVNMFDTHQAAKSLNFPKLSLAYLLSCYCNVNTQKQFQLADWRIRPLPQELLTYARQDTHYLLYIYDNLRNSLIEKGNNQTHLLKSVMIESTKICLKRYLKPIYETEGYLELYRRSRKLFDNRQKFALQRLFEWRDAVAREADESYAYVLPDHMMLNISEVLPREAQGILACCNPVPTLVRQNLMSLHQIILRAREQALVKPVLEEQRFYKHTSSRNLYDNPLQCPHDLNHEGEFRDDLPVLFNESYDVNLDTVFSCSKPLINVFENASGASEKIKDLLIAKKAIHLTPYHRYKLSKKFSESVEVNTLRIKINQNLDKEECDSFLAKEKELDDHVNDVNDDDFSEATKDVVFNKEIKADDDKIICNPTEQTAIIDKKQIEHNLKIQKLKKEVNNQTIGALAHEKRRSDMQSKKKKKKKVVAGFKKKEFQPFDFNSVDFKKYQTSAIASGKKVQKKLLSQKRMKKPKKKNYGLSI